MQRLVSLILLFILTCWGTVLGSENLSHRANQIVLLSEEMITHGGEGHMHEIITFGEKMIEELEGLTEGLRRSKISDQKKLEKQIRETRKRAEEAIGFAKHGDLPFALKSAKSASFQAKRLREALRR
jgi:hypothetical protein